METIILKKIGLNDKEIAIYIKLLELGPTSVRKIAEAANLNRGTAYDILKSLQSAGLVSYFHNDTKQNFVAENPERLKHLLTEKENDLNQIKEKIGEIIPELNSLRNIGDNKPVTRFYEGKKGIKFIMEDVLQAMKAAKEKEYFIYSAPDVREDIYAAFPDFIKKRIKNKIKVKTISLSGGGCTYGLDERKWLDVGDSLKTNMTYILIYDNKCAFISRDSKQNPVGVIIENKMIYETQKIIFLQLWKLLS